MNIENIKENYNIAFPNYPELVVSKGWLYGVWMLGNNYKSKMGYYGEYPPQYLKRVKAMFPDSNRVLHAFSGVTNKGNWNNEYTIDVNRELHPDIVGSVDNFSNLVTGKFDLILSDPPYSSEDAVHYGTPMINRNKCLKELTKVCNGYICWLDQVLPMYKKEELNLVGTIGIIRSTNHRFRLLSIFKVVE